ncbi:MAG: hypothetical protein KDE59_13255, partial [Anaerolineales bacterium]|nr:hypothetical protein [Anaerolineales bacterium]
DYDEAARLITGPALAASARSEVLTLRRWHEAFPAEFLSQNPLLALHFGVNFALNGRWSEAEALLEQIEAARSRLPMGSYLLWRYLMSHQLAAAGDWAELLASATASAEREPLAAMVLGLLLGMRGETTAALGWLDQAINLGTISGSELAITARVHRCRLLVQAGDYQAAWELGQSLLQLLPAAQPLTQLIRLTLGQIALDWLDLNTATTHLEAALSLAQRTGLLAGSLSGAELLLAEVAAARGEFAAARDHLATGLAAAHRYDSATEAAWAELFVWRLGLAVTELPPEPPDLERLLPSRFFPPRFSHLGAAWYWLRRNRPAQALPILADILAGPADAASLDAYCLLALARQAQGDPASAQTALAQALSLGQESGRLRSFLRLGQPIQALLQQLPLAPATAPFQQQLLTYFAATSSLASQVALTEREMEILTLIGAGRTNQEIAAELVVAHSTVKWYVNSLYRKLGAKSRVQALKKARELGLIG